MHGTTHPNGELALCKPKVEICKGELNGGVSLFIQSFIQVFVLFQALGILWGQSQQSLCPVGIYIRKGKSDNQHENA